MGEELEHAPEYKVSVTKTRAVGKSEQLSSIFCVVGRTPAINPREIAELMNNPNRLCVASSEIQPKRLDLSNFDFARVPMASDEGYYDYEIPSRCGRYRTRRLRKKWEKMHQWSMSYKKCKFTGGSS